MFIRKIFCSIIEIWSFISCLLTILKDCIELVKNFLTLNTPCMKILLFEAPLYLTKISLHVFAYHMRSTHRFCCVRLDLYQCLVALQLPWPHWCQWQFFLKLLDKSDMNMLLLLALLSLASRM